ncbi:MAG: imidazolonepropionase [Gammaproteobacteria bacterium]|nr:MAG: imidazolonepropionase [Gammaproteobacteria bacterium]
MSQWDTLWINVSLATMDPTRPAAYGAIGTGFDTGTDGTDAIAVKDGLIAWLGSMEQLPTDYTCETVIDGGGRWLTPGLIDCHTHLVYGGNRAEEFELRLTGVAYDEIARRGGGILATVRATRAAGEEELYDSAARRLQNFLREGVTGIEIKSGYGLNRETELKMLRVARRLGEQFPVCVSTTFLGAHALPPEYNTSGDSSYEKGDDYIDHLCRELLPEVAGNKLADAVDIFCESIGFNLEQAEKLFTAAQKLGLPIKAHVEQLSNMGGAALAAKFGARSVDHLEYLDEAGVAALQDSGTVAALLPGAFYFLRETQLPPIEQLRQAAIPMAIASDSNPGSSPAGSLLLMLNMACTLFRMTPEEALAGVTRHAAQALGWEQERGTLEVGKKADLVLWDIQHPAELAYAIGNNPCHSVVVAGQTVLTRA